MNATNPCSKLESGLGALFQCTPHGEFQRIRTPYLYPDGDNIDLFAKTSDGTTTLSDLGETSRWLRNQTLSPRRSPKQRALIDDVCLTHGVEFYKGMLMARSHDDGTLPATITRLAQAALRMSDLWFTFRNRTVESLGDEVADFLGERHLDFERSEKLVGRSGHGWTVDFHVRTPQRSSLVYVLSTGSRSAARMVTDHVVAAWYDLSHLAAGPEALRFVSLFDDTADVWPEEDFKRVEPLSAVARWSDPDQFTELLQEAA